MNLKLLGLEPHDTTSVRIGQKIGRLTIRATGRKPGTYRYIAVCDCACGKKNHLARIDGIVKGTSRSCGCLQKDAVTTHGRWEHPLYRKLNNMLKRCEDPSDSHYENYGGRGIKVCKRWHNIENFIADMESGYFPGAEIDRIDVDGDYKPSNCRWVTHSEQAANKQNTVYLTLNGRTQRLVEWSKELGIPAPTLRNRKLHYGWDDEKILTTPSLSADERCQLARDARYRR